MPSLCSFSGILVWCTLEWATKQWAEGRKEDELPRGDLDTLALSLSGQGTDWSNQGRKMNNFYPHSRLLIFWQSTTTLCLCFTYSLIVINAYEHLLNIFQLTISQTLKLFEGKRSEGKTDNEENERANTCLLSNYFWGSWICANSLIISHFKVPFQANIGWANS